MKTKNKAQKSPKARKTPAKRVASKVTAKRVPPRANKVRAKPAAKKTLDKASKVAYDAIKRKILSLARQGKVLSSMSLDRIQPNVVGSRRGALIRNAFVALQRSGDISLVGKVYNPGHRHSVNTYRA